MYSLPITIYSDYWKAAKSWSTYFGGALLLILGTNAAQSQNIFPNTLDLPALLTLPITQPAIPEVSQAEEQLIEPEIDASAIPTTIVTELALEDTQIPVETVYKETNLLPPGMSQLKNEGNEGISRTIVKKVYTGDKLSEEFVVSQFDLEPMQPQIILQNSNPVSGEKLDLGIYKVNKIFNVEATAYTYTGNHTATGVDPRQGLIAVDPRIIPLGSRLYVDGYGYAVAADTGGAIKGKKIDLFFPNYGTCLEWGRRTVKLYLLTKR